MGTRGAEESDPSSYVGLRRCRSKVRFPTTAWDAARKTPAVHSIPASSDAGDEDEMRGSARTEAGDEMENDLGGSCAAADLLPILLSDSPNARFAVIVLHGYGMTNTEMYDWLRDAAAIRPHIRFVFPQADSRYEYAEGESADTAATRNRRPSWFTYTSDFGGDREDTVELKSLEESRRRLLGVVAAEHARLGYQGRQYDKIGVVGVSQGGCMAVDLCAHASLLFCVTLVAHRMSATTGSLQTPWHALNATRDKIYRGTWTIPTLAEASTSEFVVDDHELHAGDGGDIFLEKMVDDYMAHPEIDAAV